MKIHFFNIEINEVGHANSETVQRTSCADTPLPEERVRLHEASQGLVNTGVARRGRASDSVSQAAQ